MPQASIAGLRASIRSKSKRSEERFSRNAETDLVCRLLLEKKNGLTAMIDQPPSARGGSPLDIPVFRTVQETIQESFPDATVGPYFLPWTATDARFFRTLVLFF